MVPADRVRLKGFRDREADYGECSVTRMFTEGTRAPALWGCVTSEGSRHSQLNMGLLDWRLVLVTPRKYFLNFSFRYPRFALMDTSLFINPVQGMSRERWQVTRPGRDRGSHGAGWIPGASQISHI